MNFGHFQNLQIDRALMLETKNFSKFSPFYFQIKYISRRNSSWRVTEWEITVIREASNQDINRIDIPL